MNASVPALEQPWHVRTDGGTFHSGVETEGAANALAERLNGEAEKLKIKTRYVVSGRPS
jgi:hypothetical protein